MVLKYKTFRIFADFELIEQIESSINAYALKYFTISTNETYTDILQFNGNITHMFR